MEKLGNWGEMMIYAAVDLMSGAVFALVFAWIFLACRGERSVRRFCLISLFTVYLCEMFNVVGIPAIPYFRWSPSVNLIPFGDEKNCRFFFQIGMNAVMFLPFGFLLPVLWKSCRSWKVTTLAGFAVSAMIELMQLFCFRATDVDDLLMNTLGSYLGYLLARAIFHRKWTEGTEEGKGSDWAGLVLAVLNPLLVTVFIRSAVSEWIYISFLSNG